MVDYLNELREDHLEPYSVAIKDQRNKWLRVVHTPDILLMQTKIELISFFTYTARLENHPKNIR